MGAKRFANRASPDSRPNEEVVSLDHRTRSTMPKVGSPREPFLSQRSPPAKSTGLFRAGYFLLKRQKRTAPSPRKITLGSHMRISGRAFGLSRKVSAMIMKKK